MRLDLVLRYIESQLLLLFPICPHFSEIVYRTYLFPVYGEKLGKPETISHLKWPEVDPKKIDYAVLAANEYLKDLHHSVRTSLDKLTSQKKGKAEVVKPKFTKLSIIIKPEYYEWQKKVLVALSAHEFNEKNEFKNPKLRDEWKKAFKEDKSIDPDTMKKALQFGAYILDEVRNAGQSALKEQLGYNERQVLKSYIDILKKEFGVEEILIVEAEEAAKSSNKIFVTAANNSLPGRPQLVFE